MDGSWNRSTNWCISVTGWMANVTGSDCRGMGNGHPASALTGIGTSDCLVGIRSNSDNKVSIFENE